VKLLAIETATLTASVAIVEGDATLAACEESVATHSDVLLTLIDRALAAASLAPDQLDGVAVGAGPGSFTGLRIGLATAKGLCYARELPLWTVSSLAALAVDAGAAAGRIVVPVLDAKKQEVFAAAYRIEPDGPPVPVRDERVLRPAAVADLVAGLADPLFVGNGAIAYAAHITPLGELAASARATPSAEAVARLAQTASETANLATAVPTYIRLSEAELKHTRHVP